MEYSPFMKIKRMKATPFSSGWFEDEDKRAYRRIIGGCAWPYADKPGFLCVIGEELEENLDYGVHNLRVIHEFREYFGLPFMELRPMLDCMSDNKRDMCVKTWFGDIGPWGKVLGDFNRERAKLRQPTVQVILPPGEVDFSFHAGLVRRRVLNQKTLFFGRGIIAAKLSLLPSNLETENHSRYPEVGALFMAVDGVDLTSGSVEGLTKKPTGAADRVGGY
jgi:hypothetical protein